MNLLLESWANREFEKPPTLRTLIKMGKRGEIMPKPIKVGGRWYANEHAVAVDPGQDIDPVVESIFNSARPYTK